MCRSELNAHLVLTQCGIYAGLTVTAIVNSLSGLVGYTPRLSNMYSLLCTVSPVLPVTPGEVFSHCVCLVFALCLSCCSLVSEAVYTPPVPSLPV